jgi:hypothetical protein
LELKAKYIEITAKNNENVINVLSECVRLFWKFKIKNEENNYNKKECLIQ